MVFGKSIIHVSASAAMLGHQEAKSNGLDTAAYHGKMTC